MDLQSAYKKYIKESFENQIKNSDSGDLENRSRICPYREGDIFYEDGNPMGVVVKVTSKDVLIVSFDDRVSRIDELCSDFEYASKDKFGVVWGIPTVEELLVIRNLKDIINERIFYIKENDLKPKEDDVDDMDEDDFLNYVHVYNRNKKTRPDEYSLERLEDFNYYNSKDIRYLYGDEYWQALYMNNGLTCSVNWVESSKIKTRIIGRMKI